MLRTVETRPTSSQQVASRLHRPAGVLYSDERCDMTEAEDHTIVNSHKLDFSNVSEKSQGSDPDPLWRENNEQKLKFRAEPI